MLIFFHRECPDNRGPPSLIIEVWKFREGSISEKNLREAVTVPVGMTGKEESI